MLYALAPRSSSVFTRAMAADPVPPQAVERSWGCLGETLMTKSGLVSWQAFSAHMLARAIFVSVAWSFARGLIGGTDTCVWVALSPDGWSFDKAHHLWVGALLVSHSLSIHAGAAACGILPFRQARTALVKSKYFVAMFQNTASMHAW
jgi:hypothetical protein